eukprot:359867-Chlamydomonas_euryale.AAC.3
MRSEQRCCAGSARAVRREAETQGTGGHRRLTLSAANVCVCGGGVGKGWRDSQHGLAGGVNGSKWIKMDQNWMDQSLRARLPGVHSDAWHSRMQPKQTNTHLFACRVEKGDNGARLVKRLALCQQAAGGLRVRQAVTQVAQLRCACTGRVIGRCAVCGRRGGQGLGLKVQGRRQARRLR